MESNTLAQFYQILSYVAFALAGVCFAFAVFCFFKFNVVKLINDLTGRTAKKSIAKRRSENEKSGEKSFRPTPKAKDRGTTTDKIRDSEKLKNKKTSLPVKTDNNTEYVLNSNETELLANDTEVLDEGTEAPVGNETAVLENSTAVLDEGTTVLTNNISSPMQESSSKLELIQNIVLVHTNEVI